jgi:AraC-like DNA-binding protein
MQRWLADESLTFSEVRGDALRTAAVEMQGEDGVSVPDVAFRIGFSSRAGLHRAIRRWTGKSRVS